MRALKIAADMNGFRVIHPLDDAPEQKCTSSGLGTMEMKRGVRISLAVLRAYLVLMTMMLFYHVLDLSGIVQKIR